MFLSLQSQLKGRQGKMGCGISEDGFQGKGDRGVLFLCVHASACAW